MVVLTNLVLLLWQVTAPVTRPDSSNHHTVLMPEALKVGRHFLEEKPQTDVTAVLRERVLSWEGQVGSRSGQAPPWR